MIDACERGPSMGPLLESRLESRVRAQVRVRSLGRNGLRRYCLRLWSRYADTRRVPLSILTQLGSFSRKRKGSRSEILPVP